MTDKAYHKAYYQKHKEEAKKKAKEYYHANREREILKRKAYYQTVKGQRKAYNKAYNQANKDKQKERRKIYNLSHKREDKNRRLRFSYGMSVEEYEKMSQDQNGECAICGKSPKVLRVDHDHVTGKIRKLLCNNCNISIGHAKESPEILRKMIKYLEEFENVD